MHWKPEYKENELNTIDSNASVSDNKSIPASVEEFLAVQIVSLCSEFTKKYVIIYQWFDSWQPSGHRMHNRTRERCNSSVESC